MNIVARVTPVRCHNEFKGSGQNGDYIIGSWVVKGVVDGKEFSIKAFTKDHNYLLANPTLQIDCELEITGKEYQGKFYNDIAIKSIVLPEGAQDLPQQQSSSPLPDTLTPFGTVGVDNAASDLPF